MSDIETKPSPIGLGMKASPTKAYDRVRKKVNTYIIASHQLEAGKMVMNCDWSKPSTSSFSQSAQNDHPKPLFTV
uniref:Uncharacterized protein n=1 Tax=Brassica campestris TaxID=3711 RepID=A0A3P6DSV3_BRACM|nr:unnamed protein product [Brassica rapa]